MATLSALLRKYWKSLLVLLVAAMALHYRAELTKAEDSLAEVNRELNQAKDALADAQQRQRDVAALDAHYTKELSDAKSENERLRADVDAGRRRLRINARCPQALHDATGTPGVDDAGAAELTPDARRTYYRLRDELVTSDKMLRGLQNYVRTQCLKNQSTRGK